ncbi:MAG: response regulator [Bacillota bacterium]
MDKKRLFVIDSMPLFRLGLIQLLNSLEKIEVVGEAADALEAIERARIVRPDMILMDINMPGGCGIESIREIKEEITGAKIVVLMDNDKDMNLLIEALKSGAEGYLLKSMNFEGFVRCLNGCFEGELAIPRDLAQKIINGVYKPKIKRESINEKKIFLLLCHRDKEVLKLVYQGLTNKEIATRLMVSESTVKKQLHHIMQRLNLNNRVQLAKYAVEENII